MYATSAAFKAALINNRVQEWELSGTLTTPGGQVYALTADNIEAGTLSISNQCADSEDINLGCVYLGSMEFNLVNPPSGLSLGEYRDSEVALKTTFRVDSDTTEDMPLGVYIIAEATRLPYGVKLVGYDRMYKLDRTAYTEPSEIASSHSHKAFTFLKYLRDALSIPLANTQAEIEALTPDNWTLRLDSNYAEHVSTWRDYLFYLAQALGCFATFDRLGRLKLVQYTGSAASINLNKSIAGSPELSDYKTLYGGFYIEEPNGEQTYYGADPYKVGLREADIDVVISTANQARIRANDALDQLDYERQTVTQQYQAGLMSLDEYNQRITKIDADTAAQNAIVTESTSTIDTYTAMRATYEEYRSSDYLGSTTMEIGLNPFLNSVPATATHTVEDLRWALVDIALTLKYTPFSFEAVGDPGYELGDIFDVTYWDDVTGIRSMAMSYSFDGGAVTVEGFGSRPDLAQVVSRSERGTQTGIDRLVQQVSVLEESINVDLSPATASKLGVIKVGKGLFMDADDKLNTLHGAVLYGTGQPSSLLGSDGDLYVRLISPAELWLNQNGAWVQIAVGGSGENLSTQVNIFGGNTTALLNTSVSIQEVT